MQLFLIALTVNCLCAAAYKIEHKLQECTETYHMDKKTASMLESFSLANLTITDKVLDWMVCALKNNEILDENGLLNSEGSLRKTFSKLNGLDEYIRLLQEVSPSKNLKEYSFELYKALEKYALKYTMLRCGLESKVSLRPAKQLKTFNSDGITMTINEKNFIRCFLQRMGVLGNSSELDVGRVKKIIPNADDVLISRLNDVRYVSNDTEYAYDVYQTIEKWKSEIEGNNKENSSTTTYAKLLLIVFNGFLSYAFNYVNMS